MISPSIGSRDCGSVAPAPPWERTHLARHRRWYCWPAPGCSISISNRSLSAAQASQFDAVVVVAKGVVGRLLSGGEPTRRVIKQLRADCTGGQVTWRVWDAWRHRLALHVIQLHANGLALPRDNPLRFGSMTRARATLLLVRFTVYFITARWTDRPLLGHPTI